MRSLRKMSCQAMKALLLMTAVLGGILAPTAKASAGNNNIKIVAWYGAGNLAGSEYARDTVILFNPTAAAITMTNWSLQTGGSTGSFTTVYKLPTITIPAGGFYALAGSGVGYISNPGCTSSHCNLNYAYDYQLKTIEETAPGATNTLNTDNDLSSTAVTVALVNNQTALGSCNKTSANLVDLLGIGAVDGTSPVTCYAGSGYTFYVPNKVNGANTSIHGLVYPYGVVRNNICSDTFDNFVDFSLGEIDFKNSTSAPHICPTGNQLTVNATATPNNPGITEGALFTAAVTPATSPNSTGLFVTADLSNLGLSATQQFYDDGTHGDVKAGDGIYSYSASTITSSASGIGAVPGLIVTVTDAQGEVAHDDVQVSIAAGTIGLTTTASTAVTVNAGDVATFPMTLTAKHGYSGTLNITCTGSPNTNSLGVPVSTQCVSTPNEVTVSTNGTATFSLAIATGTTFSAGVAPGTSPLLLISLGTLTLLSVAIWRRKYLPVASLAVLVSLLTLGSTGCGKNAGIGNTSAVAGTYTYTLTATDANISTITNSITFTVTVK